MGAIAVVLNHDLSQKQITEIHEELDVSSIYELPESLLEFWKQISPSGELPVVSLKQICRWIEQKTTDGDFVVIQGEFGTVFYLVDFCFAIGRIPLYATSERKYRETQRSDDSVERYHIFRHVQFRRYKRYKGE